MDLGRLFIDETRDMKWNKVRVNESGVSIDAHAESMSVIYCAIKQESNDYNHILRIDSKDQKDSFKIVLSHEAQAERVQLFASGSARAVMQLRQPKAIPHISFPYYRELYTSLQESLAEQERKHMIAEQERISIGNLNPVFCAMTDFPAYFPDSVPQRLVRMFTL
jgi:hypothetical protein